MHCKIILAMDTENISTPEDIPKIIGALLGVYLIFRFFNSALSEKS
jgi:hypothetical protein